MPKSSLHFTVKRSLSKRLGFPKLSRNSDILKNIEEKKREEKIELTKNLKKSCQAHFYMLF